MTRTYKLNRRAERQEETRQRIVEAAVALHESLGATATTVSAIAERAGVERPTVYRHFPDQVALFTACTQHYFTLNPTPDPAPWRQITDPETRLRAALSDIYSFYARTERMLAVAERDIIEIPDLREVMKPYFAYWRQVYETLAEGWADDVDADRIVRAAIAHATAFASWRSLAREQGLAHEEVIALMVCLTRCGAHPRF